MFTLARKFLVVVVVCLVAVVMAGGGARAAQGDGAGVPDGVRAALAAVAFVDEQKVVADDGASGDHFGYSVAVDGDTALVGAAGDGTGENSAQGSVYVFARSGTGWAFQQKLTAGDGATLDLFGCAVALDGDTAVVGAKHDDVGENEDQGSAYVFRRSAGIWSEEQKLTAGDGAASAWFGVSVALDGDTALVGAWGDDVGENVKQGAAYVFRRSGGSWTEEQKLTASDGAANDRSGYAVALDGDTALVGRANYDGDPGAVYVFARSGATWSEVQKLTAGDGAANDLFGGAVALDGDTALVGADSADIGSNEDQGAAYVFRRSGGSWTEEQKLTAGDGAAEDYFGEAVAVDGVTALVGAYAVDAGADTYVGAAYVFRHSAGSWGEVQKLSASDGAAYSYFADWVALDGETALVGAPGDVAGRGAAYFYRAEVAEVVYLPVVVGGG